MIKKFRTYDLALELYRGCEKVSAPHHLKEQLLRASLSVVLNTAEGSAKPTAKERRRMYSIALASCRETQALIQILNRKELEEVAHRTGGCLYRLVHPA
ncbi:MAG: four helix bundle protein [Bdellovibrionales bacterium]|nr:four helix bundle protein [Bdellovibrionales bacterium]